MIRDARVLRAGFVPSEIEHRNAEVNHLSSVLEPVTEGDPADTAIVTGPSGAGKTCLSRFVAERLREAALDVETAYVNCWRNYTRFRALYAILDAVGRTVDVHRGSTPHDELLDRLQTYDGPRTVVILDEADQLEDPDVLYDLHGLDRFALLCIANREEELYGSVDDRLVSRLRASEHVRMERYGQDELVDILRARVRQGLEPGAVTDDQLRRVADAAAGDARLALGILRTAASTAQRDGQEAITDEVLEAAAEDARVELRRRTLDALTPDQRAVYDVVADDGPLSPAEIHERYADGVDDPRSKRTVRRYLSKMVQYNLLVADGTSRDREYDLATPTPDAADE